MHMKTFSLFLLLGNMLEKKEIFFIAWMLIILRVFLVCFSGPGSSMVAKGKEKMNE